MNSWDRTDDETTRQHEYFRSYLDQGPIRNTQRVADSYGLTNQYVRRIAGKHCWQERAKSWDDHINTQADEAAGPESVKRRLEIQEQANRVTRMALERTEQILDKIDIENLTSQDISLIRVVITAYARLAVPEQSNDEKSPIQIPHDESERDRRMKDLLERYQP